MRGDRAIISTPLRTAVAAALVALCAPLLGVAQEAPESPVFIAVAGVGGSMSTLTVAYPSDPGLDQAQRDVTELAVVGQWEVSPPQRAETADGVLYESQITPAVALDATSQVPILPFLSAFRRYPLIRFAFVGEATGTPGDYHDENRFVAGEWTRAGRSVTFEFRIKDSSFETADDVRLVDRPADQPIPQAQAVSGGRAPAASLWILLLVGSVGTGVFVWGLTWWVLTRREAQDEPKKGKAGPEAKDTAPEEEQPSEAAPSDEVALPEAR